VSTTWECCSWPSRDARTLFRAVGRVGGGFLAGNFIFGLLLFNYTLCTLFRMQMGAGRDGLRRGSLDDVLTVSINRRLSIMAVGGSFLLLGSLSAVFLLIKMPVGTYNIFTTIAPFSARRGRREWMDASREVWMTFPFGKGISLSYLR
jgi:hypothetical protein